MSLVGRVVSNTSYLFACNFAERIFSMLSTVLLARAVGPEHLGVFAFAFASIGFLGILIDLGAKNIINREIAQDFSKAGAMVMAGMHLRLILSVLLVAGVNVAMSFLPCPPLTKDLLRLASLSLLLSFSSVVASVFEVRLRMGPPSLITVASSVLKVAAFALVAATWPDVRMFVVAGLCASVANVAALIWQARKQVVFSSRLRPDIWGYLLRESWPLLLAGLCNMTYMRIDQVMLYPLLGPLEAGFYSTAVRLAELLRIVPSTFMVSMAPVLSRDAVGPSGCLHRSYSLTVKYIGIAILGLILALEAGGGDVIRLVFGAAYGPAARPLAPLIMAEFFVALQMIDYNAIVSVGRQRVLFHAGVTAALLNIGLNLVFIPRWGMMGAAWASVLSYASGSVVILLSRGARQFALIQIEEMKRPILAAGLAWGAGAVLARLAATGVWGSLLLTLATYGAVLLALRVFHSGDLALLRKAWRRAPASVPPASP